MRNYELLGAGDSDVVAAIMDETYAHIFDGSNSPSDSIARMCGGILTPYAVSKVGVCYNASDLATRTAQRLGVFAAREIHFSHGITSFSDPTKKPADDDLIMCLTWGQYVKPNTYATVVEQAGTGNRPGYFGPRKWIQDFVDLRHQTFENSYGVESIRYRQTAYSERSQLYVDPLKDWLLTTPEEVMTGEYPVGEIEHDAYPNSKWASSL
jgi:hypothetical protein